MKTLERPSPSAPYHHGALRGALIDAALRLVNERQDWTFSLREVARAAGVSHNAPYNHFSDKRDLLAAVAAEGFALLKKRMVAAISRTEDPATALIKSACAYVRFGVDNPVHYRLMFSAALTTAERGRPEGMAAAGAETKAVLEMILRRGVQMRVFSASLRDPREMEVAVLSAWSAVHGLTMLALDGLTGIPSSRIEPLAEKVARAVCGGFLPSKRAK